MSEIIKLDDNHQNAITQATSHYQTMVAFVQQVMREGQDYGTIPGTNNKPTLLKPGAEKLCRLFSLRPNFELIQSVVDFDKPLFHYHYRCTLYRNGEAVGQGEGNCNSREKRYEKQQQRVYDLTNTICKMAQKRSLIAAVLVVCSASEFFTQDLEDAELSSHKRSVSTSSPTDSGTSRLAKKADQSLRQTSKEFDNQSSTPLGNREITRKEWLARQQNK